MNWVFFHLLIFCFLFLDLSSFGRKISSLQWLCLWVSLALGFNALLFITHGQTSALEFFTVYLVEGSLSIDNIFLFLVLFSRFSVPRHLYRHVLLFGVWGAILMRGLFILLGIELVQTFQWMTYIFGAMLLWTSVYLLKHHDQKNPLPRWFYKLQSHLPLEEKFHGKKFLISVKGKWHITPLFMVVLAIEMVDILFAFDSIPAALSISQNSYVIYTANIFAVVALRSLFFVIEPLMDRFSNLKYGLSFILFFMAIKLLLKHIYPIPEGVALMVIGASLGVCFIQKK